MIVVSRDWIYFQNIESLIFVQRCYSFFDCCLFFASACFHLKFTPLKYLIYLEFLIVNLGRCHAVVFQLFCKVLIFRNQIFSLFHGCYLIMSLNLYIFNLIIILKYFYQKSYFNCCELYLFAFCLNLCDFFMANLKITFC